MVRTRSALLAMLLPSLLLAGCDLFTTSPFPGFTYATDKSIDLNSRINSITAGASPVNYDLEVVDSPGLSPRVLLLVEPPSSDPNLGFNYKGQLVFMDQDLNVLGQAATPTSIDYFSKPYAYAADGNILAGYIVLSPSGGFVRKLNSLGQEGFAFTDGTNNYVFSTPGGQYASFDLNYTIYLNSPPWGILSSLQTLAIIGQGARPSTSDPNYPNLGYQLLGLSYDSTSTNITFVFSEPSTANILVARMPLATATSGSGVILPGPTSWPVDPGSWPLSLSQDRPALSADLAGIFMVQRDGWMTRYAWTSPSQALGWSGSPVQIVGDRSLNRRYAFLIQQTGPQYQYMYRFDPSSGILTRYKRWW
jgi:hypothetical protein